MAAQGKANTDMLNFFMRDDYFHKPPPKATGREYFGKTYSENFYDICRQKGLSDEDIIATATALTAESISQAIINYSPTKIDRLIISGGGAYNNTLMNEIKTRLPGVEVTTQEQQGNSSDAKEAIAFAILANETINGNTGNLPQVTGASHAKVLGKISI
jgi:anhydro-N-acetylmuramic acid kinase